MYSADFPEQASSSNMYHYFIGSSADAVVAGVTPKPRYAAILRIPKAAHNLQRVIYYFIARLGTV